ncbi:MAG TPA: ferric reductase-like transmembrane domain-containing protein [Streptosporangiaceae bacterium]|nr:ferric reductase-like transmembrane domain-containing protein [Streptosporangiaceae bacterium]
MTISFGGPGLWYATRATGLVALLLLTASVLLGVLTAGRFASPRWPRFLTVGLHRNVSLLAAVFLVLHIGTTVLDSYTSVQLSAAFIPFVSGYKRFWVGLGAVALDLLIALIVTSMTRMRLGHRTWRLVHWCGYACWPVAVAHGVGAGTDEHHSWAVTMTIGCVTAVAGLVAWRLLWRWPERRVLRLSLVTAAAVGVPAVLSLSGYGW